MKLRAWLKSAALLLGLSLALSACSPQEPTVPQEEIRPLANDGRTARVVLGEVLESPRRTQTLLEIAEKYMADYPNTQVSVQTYATPEALRTAVAAGQVHLADVGSGEVTAYLQQGLLAPLEEELARWPENGTQQPGMKWAARAGDTLHTYLVPSDLAQPILIYRRDRMEAYNQGKSSPEMIYCRTWDQIIKSAEALGDQGGLVFPGDRLVDWFDAVLWSRLTVGRLLSTGSAYFYPRGEGEEQATVFRHETALDGAEQFRQVMTRAALPETFTYTREEAVQAFVQGKASFLLADRTVLPALEAALPEDAWAAREVPLGLGVAVFAPLSYRGWGLAQAAPDADIALHFLTALSNADNNTHYAVTCDTFPLHSVGFQLEPDLVGGAFSAEVTMSRQPEVFFNAQEPVQYRAWEEYRAQAPDRLLEVIGGSLSPQELLDWLDSYWMEAYRTEGRLWTEE